MLSPYSTRLPTPPALSAGTDFSLFLHEDGSVYATGTNQYGQLGLGHTQDQIVPVLNTLLTGIRAISAGTQHSLFLDSKGRVWGCGDNSTGQLGLGPEIEQQIIPTIIPGFDHLPIIFISAGHDYSLVIDQLGRVWGFGSNDSGQLGVTPSDDPQEKPQLI